MKKRLLVNFCTFQTERENKSSPNLAFAYKISKTAKAKLLVGFLFLILVNLVLAQTNLATAADSISKEIIGKELPSPLNTFFSNEKINIYISPASGETKIISLAIEDKKIKSLELKELTDSSLNIYLDEKTLEEIQTSKDPGAALKKAWSDKKITYNAVGFLNKIKFSFLFLFSNTYSAPKAPESVKKEENKSKEKPAALDEKKVEVKINNTPAAIKNDTEEKAVKVEAPKLAVPAPYVVNMINTGFSVGLININTGEQVVWKNVRSGTFKKAMIIGTQKCVSTKSGFFLPGESFNWTFTEAGTCTIVDGIMSTQTMKVIVG